MSSAALQRNKRKNILEFHCVHAGWWHETLRQLRPHNARLTLQHTAVIVRGQHASRLLSAYLMHLWLAAGACGGGGVG